MAAPELIVALDVPDAGEIAPILERLPDQADFFKVGLELFSAQGPDALLPLKARKSRVFLDLKLHDIPRTVERSVRAAAGHGVDLLTVHAAGGRAMLRAAAEAAGESDSDLKIIAVTTLTSLNEKDFDDLGIQRTVADQAMVLGEMAIESGIHGLVTSPWEAAALRQQLGKGPLIVTPGIRPAPPPGSGPATPDDQKRVATPTMAVEAGADYLVVGRPILEADDMAAAARAILTEMGAATLM